MYFWASPLIMTTEKYTSFLPVCAPSHLCLGVYMCLQRIRTHPVFCAKASDCHVPLYEEFTSNSFWWLLLIFLHSEQNYYWAADPCLRHPVQKERDKTANIQQTGQANLCIFRKKKSLLRPHCASHIHGDKSTLQLTLINIKKTSSDSKEPHRK